MIIQKPFNIFPSVGYKNSQFQILAKKDDIKIEIFHNGDCVKEIFTSQESTVLIQKLDEPGIYTAKCNYEGEIYEQEINVRDAFRLGSSEFKEAFVFDNSQYSFFLMKDRLLLYDEVKNILLTENNYSPTKIYQLDKDNFLFITELGTESDEIVNFGIYNTNSFTIIGELLNDYQAIKISPKLNKVWLFKKSTQSIHCFELISKIGNVFTEIRSFENAKEFKYYPDSGKISINQEEKIIFVDTKNIDKFIEIAKMSNNAIDRLGNDIIRDGIHLNIINELDSYSLSIVYSNYLNLYDSDFLYIGSKLKKSKQFTDLTGEANKIKEEIIISLPEEETYHYFPFPINEVKEETIIQHHIYTTIKGLFIIEEETVRTFKGVTLKKRNKEWLESPYTTENNLFSVKYIDQNISKTLLEPTKSFKFIDYYMHCLVVKANNNNNNNNNVFRVNNNNNNNYVFRGNFLKLFPDQCSFRFNSVNDNYYLIVKDKDKDKDKELYSVFETSNLKTPLLEKVNILNDKLIEDHKVIWFEGKEKYCSGFNSLNAFDLTSKLNIQLDEKSAQHSLFKNATDYKFNKGYILSSNNIVINPQNANIKCSFIGAIESHSSALSKIVSQRINHIYLSVYDTSLDMYQEREIKIDTNKYKESYLTSNGQFLVLQDENNKYLWFDIEKNKTVRFFSGNFLSFSKEGNLIFEENRTRDIKVFDPLTFSDITPPNYNYYRFLSPDGKLYAQVAMKTRWFNRLNGNELNRTEVCKLKGDLDYPIYPNDKQEYEIEKNRIDKNRQNLYLKNKSFFDELDIHDPSKITSEEVVKDEKYTEIGIVGTNITTEIIFPEDLEFFNYAAFSYDNKYFAYVGKPKVKGLIHLFKIAFDESNNKLLVEDSYLSKLPKFASWVCGFSKTGYFATYDSNPDTYLLKIDKELFESKINKIELGKDICNPNSNIYYQYPKWNEIKGMNFLCFSPTGEYLALSEQGYVPKTSRGVGHQKSNAVHIMITETREIIKSFTGHGDNIKENKRKNVTSVAFSEDENRIMTSSSDGVVIIRNINIKKSIRDYKKEKMLTANK